MQHAKNTVTYDNSSFVVNQEERPFSNNFVMIKLVDVLRTNNEVEGIAVDVKCTKDSREPGRIYRCFYTPTGDLLACETMN